MARTPDSASAQAGGDLQRILGPARDYWNGRDPGDRRRWLGIGGVVLVVALAAGYFLTRDPMTLVYSNLSASSAGQVTQQLQTLKIPYQLQGTSIYVPASMADQARVDLAMQGLPAQGQIGYSGVLASTSLGETSQQFNLAVQNALEADLAATIDSISGVQKSVVNFTPAQQSVFVTGPSQQASAMVFVQLAPGTTLSPRQVLGIEDLVAHSVPGLTPKGVVVVDQQGYPLTAAGSASSDPASGQIGLQQSFEQNLNRQLMALLEPLVGPGNVVVQTSATLDLTQTKSQSTIVQPLATGLGVPVSQNTIKETFSGTGTPPSVAGSSGNSVPTYPTTGTGGTNTLNYTDSTVNYDVTKINQTVTSQPFTLKGLTVSVMLNSRNYKVTPKNQAAMQQVIATAIGYTNTGVAKSDITILSSPFARIAVPPFPATTATAGVPNWMLYAVGGGVAMLVLLVVLLGRRRRPRGRVQVQRLAAPPPPPQREMPEDPRQQVMNRVRDMVGDNPEEAAQLVRGWLYEDMKDRARRRP